MALDDLLLEFLFRVVLENCTSADCNVKSAHRAFIKSLATEDRCVRFATIPRRSLVYFRQSTLMWLYQSSSDQAIIVATGLGHRCFSYVLQRFIPLFNINTPHSSDGVIRFKKSTGRRRRRISPTIYLGLVLIWTKTRRSTAPLCMIFGLTNTN